METGRVSPVLARLGGAEGWSHIQAEVVAGMAEQRYDRRDMAVVMRCLESWLYES